MVAQELRWWPLQRVVDGDTLWVVGLPASVRLAGIDAPEPGQPCAAEATALVRQLAASGVVLEFAVPLRDGYGRYRAYVRYLDADGQLWTIQERLLQAGLATADRGRYRDPRYGDWFEAAEAEGIAAGRGRWGGQCAAVPTAPAAPPAPPAAAAPRPAAPPPPAIVSRIAPFTCPETHPIKLNANSGIYHVPGGQFYTRTNPEGCARTEADAIAAGYRRSLR
jgi:endonuclease YncB( thermonuclease family)